MPRKKISAGGGNAKERLMLASRLSIPQIAVKTGLTLGQLYRMLSEDPEKRRVPMLPTFKVIADVAGLTMDELYSTIYPKGVSEVRRAKKRK